MVFFQLAMMFVFIYKLSGEVGQKFNFLSACFFFFENTIIIGSLGASWLALSCMKRKCIPQSSTLPSQSPWVLTKSHPGRSQVIMVVVETFIFQDLGANASPASHAMHQWIYCLLHFKTIYCWIRDLFHQQLGKATQGIDTPEGTLQGI